jgi:hypothetical protein
MMAWIALGVEGQGGDTLQLGIRPQAARQLPPAASACRWLFVCAGWQAFNAPLKGGQLTTTAAMGNWSIN